MAKRTTHRSSKGTKLYAVRDKPGKFKDIQSYKRATAATSSARARKRNSAAYAERVPLRSRNRWTRDTKDINMRASSSMPTPAGCSGRGELADAWSSHAMSNPALG